MITLKLTRLRDTGKATIGALRSVDLPVLIWTLEDAWKGNARGISCIPAGRYECVPHGWEEGSQVRFKRVWRLLGTEPREAILIHAGNSHEDTEGCILVGRGITGSFLTNSVSALDVLRRKIGRNRFFLEIEEGDQPTKESR
ncbi:MAG: hypothetical protein IKE42_28255 [Aquamicrobium sp.]|nr:hypothetical protein [Aquamicrobium sp.]